MAVEESYGVMENGGWMMDTWSENLGNLQVEIVRGAVEWFPRWIFQHMLPVTLFFFGRIF
jgi:hypothetical protein